MHSAFNIEICQSLIETTSYAILILDRELAIRGWNPMASAVFGLMGHEPIGQHVRSIIPEFPDVGDVENWPGVLQAARPTKMRKMAEARGLARSGSEVPIELTVISILDAGHRVYYAIIRDRSVQLLHEQELQESEEKYRTIIQTADDAIISMDEHEAIISWNAGARKIFGYGEEEVLGRSVQLIIPERFRERHSQGLRRFLETERPTVLGQTMELAAVRKDGGEFAIELTPSAWKQHGRHFFTAIIRDISVRARMLAEIKAVHFVAEEANRVLRAVFDQMNQGISVFDADLNLIGCNRRFLELLDFPEHLNRDRMPFEAFIRYNAERGEYGPGDTEAQVRNRVELARQFEPHRYERARPDGTAMEITGTPLAGGGMVTTYTDITERKKAQEAIRHERATQLKHEQELKESEEKYRTIIQTADDAIISMDEHEAIISWNTGARKIFGYEEEEVLGRSVHLIIPERFRERHSQGLRRFLDTERPTVLGKAMELAAVRKDGSEFPIELTLSVWKQHGRHFFTGIIRDISVRARMLAEIQAARTAAEEANRAKSAFISTMSHELRTPLNAIIGFTRIVRRKAEGALPEKQTANLDKVLSSAEHLLGLINTVLDIAKIEAGRMEVTPANFDIRQLAEQCASLATPLLKHGVALERAMDQPIGPVFSDPDKVKQIVLNLLSNAAKFTHEGRIVLSVRQAPADGMLAISVADSGIGISEEALGRVFEEFQQADTTTTRKYGGTGLGLSISRNLARLLGGDLTASSTPGQGSTFTLTMPTQYGARRDAGTGAASSAAGDANGPAPGGMPKRRVLVIDDDPDAAYLLQESLGAGEFAIVGARNGADGLRLAREEQPQAILLDIMMPGIDGWQVLSDLKENPATRGIPVILLTIVDKKALGLRLGAAAHLLKPFDPALVVQTLRRVMGDSARTQKHILVVDDDPQVADMLRQILPEADFRLDSAADGEAGLKAVEAARPDAILLDLMMPRLDGFGFLDRLRANADLRGIPVIVISAKELTNDESAWLAQAAVGVMKKHELDGVSLADELHAVLGN